jgi:pimeloyl-ACP methyl ester carboxylesterase
MRHILTMPSIRKLKNSFEGSHINFCFSIPTDFNDASYDVLSINRPGYGGNPIPESFEPMRESIPVIAELISMVYKENSNGKHGIVLIGHSLGAAIALGIAALESKRLPFLGVSTLGIIPTLFPSALLQAQLNQDPSSSHVVIEPTPEVIETYLGPPSVFEQSILEHPSIPNIFEPGGYSQPSLITDIDRISFKV